MTVESFGIHGACLITCDSHHDGRGRFAEVWRHEWLPYFEPTQMNRAERVANSIVGLHYHLRQHDYWYAARGQIRVVLHDLRDGSPTEGVTRWMDVSASDDTGILIPPGVAHGFAALTDVTLMYLIDRYFDPTDEFGVAWNDPEIAADWAVVNPVLSERDQSNLRRADLQVRPVWKV